MEAVAVCDKDNRVLDNLKKDFGNKIKYYTDFDEFIEDIWLSVYKHKVCANIE